ncbi:MAG: diguanylate cyclase [Myxococcales bacterium]|nr:diguanylate cyclase [Myxococcales bacterium]
MTTLVQAALRVRRTTKTYYGFGAALVMALFVVGGFFSTGALAEARPPHAVLLFGWSLVFAARMAARFREEEKGRSMSRTDLEVGLLLLVAAHALVQLGGGLGGELYPLIYVLVAFIASFSQKPIGTALIGSAVAFETAIYFVTERHTSPKVLAFHSAFIFFFGILNIVFTRAEIARVREHSRRQRDEEKRRLEEESRLFRLVSAPTQGEGTDDARLFRSSIDEVHNALFHQLEILHRLLGLHTCILLLLNEEGTELQIVELVTQADTIGTGPFPVGSGAVGAVAGHGKTMNLAHIKAGYRGLCYYEEPVDVRAFVGVPVVEEGRVRGALCGDRISDEPFTPKEEDIFRATVSQLLRVLENERVFVQLERSKREQHVLYRASQSLGAALTEDEVIRAAVEAAREITEHDFVAVTKFDPKTRKHSVRAAEGEGADGLMGLEFRDNSSLTAMAIKNMHYLPYRAEFDPRTQVVFTKRATIPHIRSLLILPLIVREKPLGTFIVASQAPGLFGAAVRPTLQVLANQLAVALANASAVRRLEEMATTDGLTGCLNKRAFLEELEGKMRAAERFGRRLSLIVTDIDHFKMVNDTHGHATGDLVIKGLGDLLQSKKRETDIVARFGGEEFCVLCEETDAEGALQLAERIREELEAKVFHADMGEVRVTCSLGIASFPDDAGSGAELFESADRALYAAKNGGRNRVCAS